MLRPEDLQKALQRISARPARIRVTVDEAATPESGGPPIASPSTDDEVTARALANPEVQRFREVFGGEIRKIRNLKE